MNEHFKETPEQPEMPTAPDRVSVDPEQHPLPPVIIGRLGTSGIKDIVEHKDTPALLQNANQRTLGDVSELPDDPNLVRTIDWATDHIANHPQLAPIPDQPNIIARRHVVRGDTSALVHVAEQGVTHLHRIQDTGIVVPAHRFFVTNDAPNGHELISLTARIEGRTLTQSRQSGDAVRGYAVIASLAAYLSDALRNQESFLFDKVLSEQYTVNTQGETILHDTGLEFTEAVTARVQASDLMGINIAELRYWCLNIGQPYPEALLDVWKQYRAHRS
jgi:hypothetical protein